MKYVLCAVILAAFSATCYYGLTEGSRKRAAELETCYLMVRLGGGSHPGDFTRGIADCDTRDRLDN
jgi:hypothetical protein